MDSKMINADDKSMEENQSTASRKRRADDTFPLDSYVDIEDGGDEDMKDMEEGGESDVSSRESDQEWDVDSFDEGEEYKPRKKLDPNDEEAQKMRRYRIQMYQTNGFNVDMENYPGRVAYRELWPVDLDEPYRSGLTGRAYMQNMVDLSLERYNRIKHKTVTCEHIVRAIVLTSVPGVKAYITFMARETLDGDVVEYQAKTHKRPWQKHDHVIFCRPTPKPKVIQEPRDEDCESSSGCEYSDGHSSRGSDQKWDVDSLDDESDYKPPDMLTPTDEEVEKMRLYRPHMYLSKGFYVDGESYSGRAYYFSPVVLDEPFYTTGLTGRVYVQKMIDLALERYNKIKESSVTCESIVRAIVTRVDGYKLYVTFMARESPGGDLVEYQAKTERKVWQSNAHVYVP